MAEHITPPSPLAAFIAAQPGMAEKLLAEHRDDGTRHCVRCTAGAGAGRSTWPCTMAASATAAKGTGRR